MGEDDEVSKAAIDIAKAVILKAAEDVKKNGTLPEDQQVFVKRSIGRLVLETLGEEEDFLVEFATFVFEEKARVTSKSSEIPVVSTTKKLETRKGVPDTVLKDIPSRPQALVTAAAAGGRRKLKGGRTGFTILFVPVLLFWLYFDRGTSAGPQNQVAVRPPTDVITYENVFDKKATPEAAMDWVCDQAIGEVKTTKDTDGSEMCPLGVGENAPAGFWAYMGYDGGHGARVKKCQGHAEKVSNKVREEANKAITKKYTSQDKAGQSVQKCIRRLNGVLAERKTGVKLEAVKGIGNGRVKGNRTKKARSRRRNTRRVYRK